MVEKGLFLSQIFKIEILKDLHVLRAPVFENHIFSGWYACVFVPVNSITQKQVIAETSNMAFYICAIGRCYLRLFIKIGQKVCVQGKKNSNKLRSMGWISYYWIFAYLDFSKYNEICMHS